MCMPGYLLISGVVETASTLRNVEVFFYRRRKRFCFLTEIRHRTSRFEVYYKTGRIRAAGPNVSGVFIEPSHYASHGDGDGGQRR